MTRHRLKQTIRTIAGLLIGLLFAITAISLNAQPAGPGAESPAASAREPHPFYDITKEVTLSGPVSELHQRPVAG